MTLQELHADPEKLTAFMGWPFEDETYAVNATQRRWQEYLRSIRPTGLSDKQKWNLFVRECAREMFGITGRSVEEVQGKCIAQYPHLFATPSGKFVPPPSVRAAIKQPDVPPLPKRLRGQ